MQKVSVQGTSPGSAGSKPKRKKVDYTLLFMALPFVLFLFMFYYAQLFGWLYAFVDYKPGIGLFKQQFTGFHQFIKLFETGSRFPVVFKNTLVYGILGIAASPVPVLFAILLSEVRSRKFSRLIQTFTSFPNFISWILVYSVCFMFFSTEGQINMLLSGLGLIGEPANLLGNPDVAYVFQTLLGIWKGTGWSAIIYLAAIAGIDPELYDAADIDGANRFQKIYHITLQSIKSTYFVLLILSISGLMNAGFEQYYVFYNPLVSERLDVISTYVYRVGLGNGEISFATAMGLSQSVISIILLFTVNRIARKLLGSAVI